LKVGNSDAVFATVELALALPALRLMSAIVIDDQRFVDVELGAIVGGERKLVLAGFVGPKRALIVGGKPCRAAGDTRYAFDKCVRRNIERRGIYRSD
jgi:hypothetical protein